jgi:hypothetical protein
LTSVNSEIRTEINLTSLKFSEWNLSKEFPMPPHEEVENSSGYPLEESWYYYLTEISQRPILDRILNAFYSQEDDSQWLEVSSDDMVGVVLELEQQLTTAAATLPTWLRYSPDAPDDRELPYFIHRRMLYVQECLFKPFLFRVIHSSIAQPPMVREFAQRCVEACRANVLQTAIQHRHHGSWFIGRGAFRCGLAMIAAAQSGKLHMPQDWLQCVETAIAIIEFWEKEATDLQKLSQILRSIFQQMKIRMEGNRGSY